VLLYEVYFLNYRSFFNGAKYTPLKQSLSILSESANEIYVVLLDLNLPDGTGLYIMEHLVNTHSYLVGVIVVTEISELQSARQFFQLGTNEVVAVDYQLKGELTYDYLVQQVNRTVRLIDGKRKHQTILAQNEMWQKLDSIDHTIHKLNGCVIHIYGLSHQRQRIIISA